MAELIQAHVCAIPKQASVPRRGVILDGAQNEEVEGVGLVGGPREGQWARGGWTTSGSPAGGSPGSQRALREGASHTAGWFPSSPLACGPAKMFQLKVLGLLPAGEFKLLH